MEAIKKILRSDVRALNQSIVETQAVIDKCFNTMLDALPGTDEYLKVKVEHDIKSQEKWLYYGQSAPDRDSESTVRGTVPRKSK